MATLLSIPHSHYAELGRWALQHAGINVTEESYLAGAHSGPVAKFRGPHKNPSCSLGVTGGTRQRDEASARSTAIPVALLPDGRIGLDSWGIVQAALPGDTSITPELQQLLDGVLGQATAWLVWYFALKKADNETAKTIFFCTAGEDSFANDCALYDKVLKAKWEERVPHVFGLKPEDFDENVSQVREVFRRVDSILSERPFLSGSEFGAADMAFAALSAFILMPPTFGFGAVKRWPKPDDLPLEWQRVVQEFRATVAGQHALRLYETVRCSAPGKVTLKHNPPEDQRAPPLPQQGVAML